MDMSRAIREGRERLGMSQEALAERLSVSRQAVSKLEMGVSVPSPENRRALSELLAVDFQAEPDPPATSPPRRWKRLTLAAGPLCLTLMAALGRVLYVAHQDGWPPPDDPWVTGVYFYDEAGQEITKSDFGWYLFPPDSTVTVAVTFRDGRTFALFRWEIPASLYSHFEVQLEYGDGRTASASGWNVIDRDSAF